MQGDSNMIKDQVLEQLNQSSDFQSGQGLADALGVSRNAVWKAIRALQEEGYEIESRTNLGYRLIQTTRSLNQLELERISGIAAGRLHVVSSLPSTNTYLKDHHDELDSGTVILTSHQTAGRGRSGRSFHSPAGDGLYFSFLYKGLIPNPAWVTLAAGVAVTRVLEARGLDPAIKWVNDIYIDDRKVCGILTEGELELESGQMKYLVVGIGLNVNNPDFPPELASLATSMFRSTGVRSDLNELTCALIHAVDELMAPLMPAGAITNPAVIRELITAVNARLHLKGRQVTLKGGNQPDVTGILVDIDEQGHLRLASPEGIRVFSYGEYRLDPTPLP